MPNIMKTAAELRLNVEHIFSTFLDADSVTMAREMADYTFKTTKFTSHVGFIGLWWRKILIPKGFRLKFHHTEGDRRGKPFFQDHGFLCETSYADHSARAKVEFPT